MKNFNKILITIILITSIISSVGISVFAQSGVTSPTGTTGSGVTNQTGTTSSSNSPGIFTLQNPLEVNSIGELLQSFIQIITYLAILLAVLMFIYLGFQYVLNSAKGNASEITKLHSQLMWLIIGVAIIIGARVIIQIVINTLSATGAVSPGVIQNANNAIQGK